MLELPDNLRPGPRVSASRESGEFDRSLGSLAFWPLAWLSRQAVLERDRWALWLPVAFAAGIAIYFALPVEPHLWLGLALALIATGTTFLARHQTWLFLLSFAVLLVSLGFAVAQWRSWEVAAPALAKRIGPLALTGQVEQVEPKGAGRRVVLQRLQIDGLTLAETPERLRLHISAAEPDLRPGQWLQATAVLRPPPRPAAPGAYDFARRAYFERLGGVGYAMGRPRVLQLETPSGRSWTLSWTLWWADLRQRVAERVREALPGPSGAVAAALMTGERGAIDDPVMTSIRDSGIAHLLAISGLHVGLVAGLLFFAVRASLALIPRIALYYPIKKWAAVVAALGAFGYLALVGMTVPTQRAFIMIGLVLLAVVLDRSAFSMRLVAWAAAAILVLSPESLLSISFQMSFAAVAALIAAYESFGGTLKRGFGLRPWWQKLLFYLIGVALTSLIAGMATAPFALFHFNRFVLFGIVTNLLAVPLTAFWIMPLAIGACLAMPFGLEIYALTPMGWGIDVMLWSAENVAAWPQAVLTAPAMPMAGLILVGLGLAWLCIWKRPWRSLGFGLIILGCASLTLVRPPDILANAQAGLFAVRPAGGGLHFVGKPRDQFIPSIWLRRAGQPGDFDPVGRLSSGRGPAAVDVYNRPQQDAPRLTCDSLACIYQSLHASIALVWDERALSEDCQRADVVLSLRPLRRRDCSMPSLVVDRWQLWRQGTLALWVGPKRVESLSVAQWRGKRPWSYQRN